MTAASMSNCPNHHPSEALLMDYASGSLGEAWNLGIATHLALCPLCRESVRAIEAIGGGFLDDSAPVSVSDGLLDAVMARLETSEPLTTTAIPATRDDGVLPGMLRRYLGGDIDTLPWKRLGLGAYHCVVPTKDDGTTARLLWIPAGRPVPEHTHRGLEMTIVLRGAFSDQSGAYARGDFEEADEQTCHQPHALPGEDCICLAVTDAPLRFTSFAARMVQPLLGI
ncbi:MAG: ChrR family anti-sigma-E factor [Rhodospirillales bacterium]